MSNQLGPLEIVCDSPPYAVVRACQRLGFQSPEDVRWCRKSRLNGRNAGWREILRQPWKLFQGPRPSDSPACLCGRELPGLEKCTFTLVSGQVHSYLIGQCRRCHTVFWENA